MGFVLSVTYLTFQKRQEYSFWTTTLIHSVKNAMALLTKYDEMNWPN